MRKRGNGRSWLTIAAIAWSGFFLHSCVGPRSPLDPAVFGQIHCAPRIQVGLSKFLRVPAAAVVLREDFVIYGARGPILKGAGTVAPIELLPEPGGIKVGGVSHPETSLRITTTGEFLLNTVHYPGELLVLRDEDRETKQPRLTLINEVDLEQYLMGVVGMEMSLSASEEALKAQVVAARTYAMAEVRGKTLRNVKNEKFDVYDDDRSQVYGGRERTTPTATRLVQETRGLFVVYDGRIFKTYFSSTCGGHTEPAKQVLGEVDDIPPLRGTTCGYCTSSKYYRWKAELPRADVARKVLAPESTAKIKSVRVISTLPGGHANEVGITIEGSAKETKTSANDGFRRKIDPRSIRSTLWESVEIQGDKLVITGRGWGHGCGMCQVGAYGLALLGKTATEILEHYYPQAKVQKLY